MDNVAASTPVITTNTVFDTSLLSSNNQTKTPPTRNEELVIIEIAVQAVIMFFAVFGNCIVLLVLCLRGKKLSRMNLLIVHLSLADLFVAFFNILPQLIWDITFRFQGNDFLCRSVKFFQVVAMYASSYVLVTTAIDRYLAICHPLTSHTWSSSKVHLMVGVAWGLSLLFSIPQTIIFAYIEVAPNTYDCWATFNPKWTAMVYVTWFFIAVYVIPACFLTLTYGRICFVVWRSVMSKEPSTKERSPFKQSSPCHYDKKTENGKLLRNTSIPKTLYVSQSRTVGSNPRAHVSRSMSNAKLKTVKLTLTVIVCYLVCWSPFFIAQIWVTWDPRASLKGMDDSTIRFEFILSSCLNYSNDRFKVHDF